MADAAVSMAVPDEFGQRGRWRAFRDASVEAGFRAWHQEEIVALARVVGIVSVVIWGSIPLLYLLVVGTSPLALRIGAWAISVPLIVGLILITYTRYVRWANEILTFALLIIGLNFIWLMSALYSTVFGTVSLTALVMVFLALALRLRTGGVAVLAVVLCGLPAVLLVIGTLDEQIPLEESWPYISVLLTMVPMVILASAQTEAGMRQQFAAQRQLQASQRLLRRYVPEQVADAVLSNRSEAVARHERRKLTIFFSDLVGFTDLSDEMEPEDLATVLHDYFTEMSTIARKHGGTVDDLIGDAVLVLFGAPDFTDDRDQARRAVRMAMEMQEAMVALNERWESAGIPETLTVRMGINTGVATVGNFGSAERTKYTALGKQVNIAARIQSQCQPGKVLIGHTTWLLVREETPCTPKGELVLKGLRKPMPAYEVKA